MLFLKSLDTHIKITSLYSTYEVWDLNSSLFTEKAFIGQSEGSVANEVVYKTILFISIGCIDIIKIEKYNAN